MNFEVGNTLFRIFVEYYNLFKNFSVTMSVKEECIHLYLILAISSLIKLSMLLSVKHQNQELKNPVAEKNLVNTVKYLDGMPTSTTLVFLLPRSGSAILQRTYD